MRTITEIEKQICETSFSLLKIYKQNLAIESVIARYSAESLASIACGVFVWNSTNDVVAGDLLDRVGPNSSAAKLAAALAMKGAIAAHPDLAEATALCAPLFKELEAATAKDFAEKEAAEIIAGKRREAMAEAVAKAEVEIARQFSEPPALIRGRIKTIAG